MARLNWGGSDSSPNTLRNAIKDEKVVVFSKRRKINSVEGGKFLLIIVMVPVSSTFIGCLGYSVDKLQSSIPVNFWRRWRTRRKLWEGESPRNGVLIFFLFKPKSNHYFICFLTSINFRIVSESSSLSEALRKVSSTGSVGVRGLQISSNCFGCCFDWFWVFVF